MTKTLMIELPDNLYPKILSASEDRKVSFNDWIVNLISRELKPIRPPELNLDYAAVQLDIRKKGVKLDDDRCICRLAKYGLGAGT